MIINDATLADILYGFGAGIGIVLLLAVAVIAFLLWQSRRKP